MEELIKRFKELEKELEKVKKDIRETLGMDESFEFVSELEKENTDSYETVFEKVIDGVIYRVINRDDIDHESHYELCVIKVGD